MDNLRHIADGSECGERDASVLKWTGANSGGAITGVVDPSTGFAYAGWDLNQATAYDVAADLVVKILNAPDVKTQEDLSFALWELFAPDTAAAAVAPANAKWGGTSDDVVDWLTSRGFSGTGSDLANATADVEAAIKEVTTAGFTMVWTTTRSRFTLTIKIHLRQRCGTGLTAVALPNSFRRRSSSQSTTGDHNSQGSRGVNLRYLRPIFPRWRGWLGVPEPSQDLPRPSLIRYPGSLPHRLAPLHCLPALVA